MSATRGGSVASAPVLSPYQGRFYTVVGGTHRSSATTEHVMVVEDVSQVADEVATVTLREASGAALPKWAPGAHLDLVLPDGRSTQYSLCGDPNNRFSYRIGVLRRSDATSVSHAVHRLGEGDEVRVRGPRNHFALTPAGSYLFLAGGIGITPLLPMIRQSQAADIPWHLVYVGRSRSSMAFLGELDTYQDQVTIWARDEQQDRFDVASVIREAPADSLVYCCGPLSLIDTVEAAGADLAPDRIRTERFSVVPLTRVDDTAIQVRCELSDITLEVPAGTSILESANRAGIATVSSCNKGICGTCETVVLDGTPDHRDSVLDEDDKAEGDTMMICVSRALGSHLVLDL